MIFDAIKSIQLVVMLAQFRIVHPENVKMLFSSLVTVAAFDVMPTDQLYEALFGIDPDEGQPLTKKFAEMGMEHHLIINNLGTIFLAFVILLLLSVIHLIMKTLFRRFRCCRKAALKLGTKLYFGAYVSVLAESYVIILLACLINLVMRDAEPDENWKRLNLCLTVLFLAICLLFPIGSIALMLCKWNSLH